MANVGLMTYHASQNQGSFLQAYATQQAITRLGHQCTVIDFSLPMQQYAYQVWKPLRSPKDVLKNMFALAHYRDYTGRYRNFVETQRTLLHMTAEHYSDPAQLQAFADTFDVVVAGSDQIWNTSAWDYDDAYLLNFVGKHTKKVSYASSMGGHILDKQSDMALARHYQALLSDFASIAVREQDAVRYLQPLVRQQVQQVVDPTLLLTSAEYDDIAAPRMIDKPYIFYYAIDAIDRNAAAARAVQQFAARLGLPVYVMWTGNRSYGLKKYGFRLVDVTAGPREYISLIKYADHVLSASFHGTAFSVIYRKPFHVVRGVNPDGTLNMDNRLSSLLALAQLEARQLFADRISDNNWLDDVDMSVIDYDTVYAHLMPEIQRSRAYLAKALEV